MEQMGCLSDPEAVQEADVGGYFVLLCWKVESGDFTWDTNLKWLGGNFLQGDFESFIMH